jgi:hypothetical protein
MAHMENNVWAIIADPKPISSANNKLNARVVSMENRSTGERRHIIAGTLMAQRGSRYALTITPDHQYVDWWKIGNSDVIIPDALVDNRMHTVYSVVVERVNENGEYQTPTLSRACRLPNLMKHIQRQQEIGIVPGNPLFINPLGYMHKDVLIMMALLGKSIGYSTENATETKAAKSVMNIYAAAERELLGIQ